MKLGKLTEKTTDGKLTISGNVTTYAVDLEFRLEPNQQRQTDKSPTHSIVAKGKHGRAFGAGAAWQGKTKEGERMYTLIVEVPELFAGELSLVAWDNKDGTFDIQVSKPKETEQVKAA